MRIKQRDQSDCGPACLASVAGHYGLNLSVAKIKQLAGTDKQGTSVHGLKEAAVKLGFDAKAVKTLAPHLTNIPLPAIAHIVSNNQLHHYVVIYKAKKQSILIMDPADGKMYRKPMDLFAKEWTKVLILLEPNEPFLKGDEKLAKTTRFWGLLFPHKSILLQALFGAFIYTVLGLSTAIFVQKITDFVLIDGNRNLLNLMSVAMIIILLLQLGIGTAKNIFILHTGQQIDSRLILGYYKHLLRLPQSFFDNIRVGEVTSRINDAVKIRKFINDVSIGLVVNLFIVFSSLALMFTYYWKLGLLMLILTPLYLLVYFATNALNKKTQRKLMEDSATLESQLVESLNTISTVKQFGLEEFTNEKAEFRFIKLLRTIRKSSKVSIFSNSSVELISQLLTILLLWVGTHYVLDNKITPGELFSLYTLITFFTSPAAALVDANKSIQDAYIASDRLFEIMDLEIEKEVSNISLTIELIGDICFKNVSFTYNNRSSVFQNLNLNIKAGSFTAIIGESGSGKSTLMALLQKIYPIQGGDIFIGKYSLNYLNTASLRKIVSIVPQRIELFAGNVIENIAIGEEEPNMQRIIDICTQLGFINYIESLPRSFQTYLGENGTTLSGGQKQRIAIARALYRDPEILILDEASSSLDSAAENHVQSTVNLLIKNKKTVIVIAHRLTSVCKADHIIVLDKGNVVEEGSHQQMLHADGYYAALWRQQFGDL